MTEFRAPDETLTDAALLARFAGEGDEGAFRALAARYGGLVHGTCRRILGRDDLAEDAAQETFVLLARRAGRLIGHPSLAGWLHATARNVARDLRRRERRRDEVERAASGPDLVVPVDLALDDALARLRSAERDVIVRRFLHGEALAELGARLGVSEDAARMRVNRALDALRGHLAHGGVAITAERLGEHLLAMPRMPPMRSPLPRPVVARRVWPWNPRSPWVAGGALTAAILGVAIVRGASSPEPAAPTPRFPVVRPGPRPIPAFPETGVRAIPLRLTADAVERQVWGRCFLVVPIERGGFTVRVGSRRYRVRVSGRSGEGTVFDVDRNADGRFAPGERIALRPERMWTGAHEWFTSETVETRLDPPAPGTKRLGIGFRVVPDTAPTVSDWAGGVVVAPTFAYVGRADLDGRSRLVAVTSVGTEEAYLAVDRDGNGRAGDGARESYRLNEPFTVGGRAYRWRLALRGDHASLEIAPVPGERPSRTVSGLPSHGVL